MNTLIRFATAVAVLTIVGVCFARAEGQSPQTVIVPRDKKPFKVSESDLVRLTGRGIAGSQISADIDGPAKIAASFRIAVIENGMPLIGNDVTEFDIAPTGKGKVTVTITVKPPQPGAQPMQSTYTFEPE